jgi:hypothetical protein
VRRDGGRRADETRRDGPRPAPVAAHLLSFHGHPRVCITASNVAATCPHQVSSGNIRKKLPRRMRDAGGLWGGVARAPLLEKLGSLVNYEVLPRLGPTRPRRSRFNTSSQLPPPTPRKNILVLLSHASRQCAGWDGYRR